MGAGGPRGGRRERVVGKCGVPSRNRKMYLPFPHLRLRLVQRCLSRKPQWNAQLKGFQIRRNADEQKMEARQGN